MDSVHVYWGLCVCVCVCVRLREREREGARMREENVSENYLELKHSEAHSRSHTGIVFWLRATWSFGLGQAITSVPQFSHLKNYNTCLLGLF